MMRISTLAAVMLLQLASSTAQARQDAAAASAADVETVKVAGTRDPDFKTYRAFLPAFETFDARRQLAPAAPLRFILRTLTPVSFEGVTMRIAGNETSFNVPVGADGTFDLPRSKAAADEDADILINRKKGSFRWRPDIHTPGLPANARRLGDLRLECAMRWATERAEMNLLQRGVLGAVGGPCNTPRINVMQWSQRALSAVYLSKPGRRAALVKDGIRQNGHVYIPPLHDPEWPDDTLIELEYAGEAAPAG